MKHDNLYSYTEFITEKNNSIKLNEGIFSWVTNMIKAAWEKNKKDKAKLKHQAKIKIIQDETIKLIHGEIEKLGDLGLELNAEIKANADISKQAEADKNAGVIEHLIFEADAQPKLDQKALDANKNSITPSNDDTKKTFTNLKSNIDKIKKIIDNYTKKAELKVDALIANAPDAEKASFRIEKEIMVIDIKNDILTKELKVAEKAEDKGAVKNLADEIKKNTDEITQKIKTIASGKASDQANIIEVDGVEYLTQKPYRYKSETGLKTINITGKSDIKGKIKGQYVTTDFGDGKTVDIKEQDFTIANIEQEFEPIINTEYNYYSKTNKAIIKIKVISEPKDDMVDVKVSTNDDSGAEFKVNKGALLDIKKQ